MRFRREALAATVLRHPNIVACLEAGTDDDQPYLVMELIEGEDLAARLRRAGRLEPAEAARIGPRRRARARRRPRPRDRPSRREARQHPARPRRPGDDHRLRDRPSRRRCRRRRPGHDTRLGPVFQPGAGDAAGRRPPASDVYGLGLVLYEAVTGRRAWRGDTTAALAAVRIGAPAPSPRAIRPEVPAALDALIVRCSRRGPGRVASRTVPPSPLHSSRSSADPSRRARPSSMRQAAGSGGLAWAGAGAVGPPRRSEPARPTGRRSGPARRCRERRSAVGQAATPGPAMAPPIRPSARPGTSPARVETGSRPARPGTARRPSPAVAGPLLVLLSVLIVVGGALFVASRPPGSDAGALAAASASAGPRRERPQPRPRPRPRRRHPKPTAEADRETDRQADQRRRSRDRARARPTSAARSSASPADSMPGGYAPCDVRAGRPVRASQRLVRPLAAAAALVLGAATRGH